jgi:hypothetical protein
MVSRTIGGFGIAPRAAQLAQKTASRKVDDCDMLAFMPPLSGQPFGELDEDATIARIPDFVESNDQS